MFYSTMNKINGSLIKTFLSANQSILATTLSKATAS